VAWLVKEGMRMDAKRVLDALIVSFGTAVAWAALDATPAKAQVAVVDAPHIAHTVAESAKQIAEAQRQYQQLVTTYESITGARGISGIASGLAGLRAPGSEAERIPGLSHGEGLGDGADAFVERNRFHEPTGDDEAAEEMRRQYRATANIQAEAQRRLAAIQERRASLDEFIAASEGTDESDLQYQMALRNRIATEQAFLANEQQAIANLGLMQRSQEQVTRQRAEQRSRRDYEEWRERARAAATAAEGGGSLSPTGGYNW
jgi:hypothetical protein